MRTWGAGFPAAEYKALSPEVAAQKLRADFSLSVPVDMEAVLKRTGILMVSISLGEDIATVLDTRSSVPVVLLDSTIAADQSKKRAALAHALGHYIAEYGFKGIYIDKKERLVPSESHLSMQDELSERKARAFATVLLLPQEILLKIVNDFDDSLLPFSVDLSVFGSLTNADLIAHIRRAGKCIYKKTESAEPPRG